jgi:hypothetical protein
VIGDADFAYAQARLQARHGTRLAEHEWRRLEAMHDVAQYVHALRATSRARWVKRITPDMSGHALEARLRAEWRAYAEEVARFQPEAWRAAIAWTAFLVDLPVIDHLLRGGPVHRWMAEDDVYAPWSRTDAHERERALAVSPLGALLRETRSGSPAAQAWLTVWRALCPRVSPAHSHALETVLQAVGDHVASIRQPAAASSFELRLTLARRLGTLFRRHFETAAATVIHLLLEWLDLERVRAGLVRRALEPVRAEAA